MLLIYLKIAWRNLLKSRYYALVNIAGLSVGMVFTFSIIAYSWGEFRVNHELKNVERQYILESKWRSQEMGNALVTIAPLAKALYDEYPSLVANYYRFDGITTNVSNGRQHFRESFQIGDSSLLRMYGFELLYGNPVTALSDPFSVVITKAAAIKYFGTTDVTGRTLSIENFSGKRHDFNIGGVLKEHSRNSVSSLLDDSENQFYLPATAADFFGRPMDSWDQAHVVSYLELNEGVDPASLAAPIKALLRKNAPEFITDNLTQQLIPLKEYYLNRNDHVVRKTVRVLIMIAFFILLMAVVNFVNMSVSHSSSRLREIGIRKVLGGRKGELMLQFLSESLLMVLFATLVALGLYAFGKNFLSELLGRNLPEIQAFPATFALIPPVFVLLLGIISGLYPAFILSSFRTVDSLKGKTGTVRDKIWLRKSLVGFQFIIASIVFIGAMVITRQINYFFSKNIGYNKDYVVTAQVPRDWSAAGVNRMDLIRQQLSGLKGVKEVSLSFEIPDGRNSGKAAVYRSDADSASAVPTDFLNTDEYYATTYGIPLVAGTFFSKPGNFTDPLQVVINETAAHMLGWENASSACGKQVRIAGDPQLFTIAGVTGDFHFGSMHQEVKPIIFMHVEASGIYRYLSVKLESGDISKSLQLLTDRWAHLMPGAPFEYRFMDDTLKSLYKTEIQLRKASYTAFILALIIVMLGIPGLVAMSIHKRMKEIGIRKVLGSSSPGIIFLFLREFLLVMAVAALIASPLAYLLMQNWLNSYAYRIQINFFPFLISITLLGTLTSLLIAVQTLKIALSNPVNILKTE